MFRNILKFNFFVLAAALAFFALAGAAEAKSFTLKSADKDFAASSAEINLWKSSDPKNSVLLAFDPEKNYKNYILQSIGLQKNTSGHIQFYNYNAAKIYQFIKTLEPQINRDPSDSVFKMEAERVTEFDPGTNGQDLDIKKSIESIGIALNKNLDTADLVINETAPKKTLAETNNLGIKELIGQGDSSFAGSPNNRIFNIKVGASKEAGIIIKPGEEFSFNKYLGPVDGEHGFKPELVIKKEGTVPEFGGGLCQVSSTTFRAAMNAGLPITARRNHSYAVQYYSPQGTDATIYPGVQDLKFINDTGANILVWPTFPDKYKLRFSFYGTKDRRTVAFEGPNVYDKKPDGSMKATWTRYVTLADGSTKKDVFKSTYQSPALFHKVEEFPKPEQAGSAQTTQNQTPTSSQAQN